VSRWQGRFCGWGSVRLVNTAHHLGSTLGVGILVAASAGAGTLAGKVTDAYLGGTIMLAVALLAVLVLTIPPGRGTRHQGTAGATRHRLSASQLQKGKAQ
jgi:hypothetical protein